MDVLTKAMDEVAGQITKANVAMKTCQRYNEYEKSRLFSQVYSVHVVLKTTAKLLKCY